MIYLFSSQRKILCIGGVPIKCKTMLRFTHIKSMIMHSRRGEVLNKNDKIHKK